MWDTNFQEELYHHGIKGQKWGVRRYQNEDGSLTDAGKKRYYEGESLKFTTSKGEVGYLHQRKPGGIGKLLLKNEKYKEEQDKTKFYDAYANGKKIGDLILYKESNTSINGNWLGVKESERGKGYATAILKSALGQAKMNGFKEFTLEVPGTSPDARHIYEKLGFVAGEQISDEDDVWGGLTAMKKHL